MATNRNHRILLDTLQGVNKAMQVHTRDPTRVICDSTMTKLSFTWNPLDALLIELSQPQLLLEAQKHHCRTVERNSVERIVEALARITITANEYAYVRDDQSHLPSPKIYQESILVSHPQHIS